MAACSVRAIAGNPPIKDLLPDLLLFLLFFHCTPPPRWSSCAFFISLFPPFPLLFILLPPLSGQGLWPGPAGQHPSGHAWLLSMLVDILWCSFNAGSPLPLTSLFLFFNNTVVNTIPTQWVLPPLTLLGCHWGGKKKHWQKRDVLTFGKCKHNLSTYL